MAIGAILLSIAMVGFFALMGGGLYLIASRRDPRKGLLMWVAALVLLGNILILTL